MVWCVCEMMILSLESYSAVIMRRDCPPFDPVTPRYPRYHSATLSLSWASVLPLCRLIGPQLIYLLLLLWLLLWLYYVWCASDAPMPRPRTMPSLAVREISLSQLSWEFWILYEIFDCCWIDLSLCWATNSPNLWSQIVIHNDQHDAHSLRRVKGCHNALRIEHVEMVTTETDREGEQETERER